MKGSKGCFFHYILPSVLLSIGAIVAFFLVDRPLLSWVASLKIEHCLCLRLLSYIICPTSLIIGVGCMYLFVRFLTSRAVSAPLFEIVITQCCSFAVTSATKIVSGRARPNMFFEDGIYGFYGFHLDTHYHSFPSGHTLSTFALATSLSLLFPRYHLHCYLTAALISLSRLLIIKHYLSDILEAASIGIIIAMIVHFNLGRVIKYTKYHEATSFR